VQVIAEEAKSEEAAPREVLSAAEERFEHWYRAPGAVLAPIAFVVVYFVLLRDTTLSPAGRRLSAILASVGVLWISEALPLPVTALLGASLCIVLGVADARTVMAPFADPLIFLFLGSFMLARAMEIHRIDRRIALRFLSIRWIGGRPARVLAGMGVICATLSMWVSNTATTAMMLPIALGVLSALHEVRVRGGLVAAGPLSARTWPFATAMMLMLAYGSSIGGIGTKVGSPPNLITAGQLERVGHAVPFFTWMLIMVPIVAVMGVCLFVLLFWLHRDRAGARGAASPEQSTAYEASGLAAYLRQERAQLGPWTPGQVNTLIAFAVAVALWVLPGIVQAVVPDATGLIDFFGSRGQLPEATVALIAALLLFMLPVNLREGRFTLTWAQAVRIDWGTLLLFGGGMALGNLMMSDHTGVARALGDWAVAKTGTQSVWGLTAAMIVLAVFLSETTSNTAAAVMLAPIATTLALRMGVSPLPPALGVCLGASYGFMLPVSTAPNAIVFGSGLVPITRMMRAGILFDLIGAVVIWAGLRVMLPALGLV
jgi:solute carrier family 13 (sodium-dependent dicarboxylate transporter), member 2/3/5